LGGGYCDGDDGGNYEEADLLPGAEIAQVSPMWVGTRLCGWVPMGGLR
jgi:hypothetical protein